VELTTCLGRGLGKVGSRAGEELDDLSERAVGAVKANIGGRIALG
jgi:hypothetical protein